MSKVENVNFGYICDLAFETRKQFLKYNLSDEHLNKARKEYEDEVEDKLKLKLKLKLKQILMIISTPELSLN